MRIVHRALFFCAFYFLLLAAFLVPLMLSAAYEAVVAKIGKPMIAVAIALPLVGAYFLSRGKPDRTPCATNHLIQSVLCGLAVGVWTVVFLSDHWNPPTLGFDRILLLVTLGPTISLVSAVAQIVTAGGATYVVQHTFPFLLASSILATLQWVSIGYFYLEGREPRARRIITRMEMATLPQQSGGGIGAQSLQEKDPVAAP